MKREPSHTDSVLAIVNFAQTKYELYSAQMHHFRLTTESVYRQAETIDGHIASAKPEDDQEHLSFFERNWGRWGPFQVPSYYRGGTRYGEVYEASALSVWRDLPALHSFVYNGSHLMGIRKRHHWFEPKEEANYAMWWTQEWPTWEEGARRLELQQQHGPSRETFTFKHLFDKEGNRIFLRDLIKKVDLSAGVDRC